MSNARNGLSAVNGYLHLLPLAAYLLVAGCAAPSAEPAEDRTARILSEQIAEFARALPEDADRERIDHQAVLVRHGVYLTIEGDTVPLPERSVELDKLECVACASHAPEPSNHAPDAVRRYEPIQLKVR